MPKIPRDVSGREMAKLLKIYGYNIIKEKGSHIRLLSGFKGSEHKILYKTINRLRLVL